jgi:predicted ABC-type transport system involved in lysophospholipase L1 biosynthesis ATPase subunit
VEVHALRGVSFDVEAGSFLAFVGPSGSGKTTLLNLIGCLDKPSAGRLEVAGVDVTRLTRLQAAAFRGDHLGFVFQSFNRIPVLTAFENVEYPLVMVQNRPASTRRRAGPGHPAAGRQHVALHPRRRQADSYHQPAIRGRGVFNNADIMRPRWRGSSACGSCL